MVGVTLDVTLTVFVTLGDREMVGVRDGVREMELDRDTDFEKLVLAEDVKDVEVVRDGVFDIDKDGEEEIDLDGVRDGVNEREGVTDGEGHAGSSYSARYARFPDE
jgi:hypothetical protein